MADDIAQLRELEEEITRLRGLLIDPGNPAWEDARAVLVTELRKAELSQDADQVAEGGGAWVPSWIALNLIGQARKSSEARVTPLAHGENG